MEEETKKVVVSHFESFGEPKFEFVKMQKQVGGQDCGLFAIAIVLANLFCVS